jgi:hypothetical protein
MLINIATYANDTELSKYIWSLKTSNRPCKIKWTILKHSSAYRSVRKQCNLCSDEKLYIRKFKKNSLLNKRSEIFSNCVDQKQFMAGKYIRMQSNRREPSYTTEERASRHAQANKTKRLNLVNRTLVVRRLSVNSGTDDRLYHMSHSAKIVSEIFYAHALSAILAVSVIHAMKCDHDVSNDAIF